MQNQWHPTRRLAIGPRGGGGGRVHSQPLSLAKEKPFCHTSRHLWWLHYSTLLIDILHYTTILYILHMRFIWSVSSWTAGWFKSVWHGFPLFVLWNCYPGALKVSPVVRATLRNVPWTMPAYWICSFSHLANGHDSYEHLWVIVVKIPSFSIRNDDWIWLRPARYAGSWLSGRQGICFQTTFSRAKHVIIHATMEPTIQSNTDLHQWLAQDWHCPSKSSRLDSPFFF